MVAREVLEDVTRCQELLVGGDLGGRVREVCLRSSEDNVKDLTVATKFFEKHQANVNVLSILVTNRSVCDSSCTLIVTIQLYTVGKLHTEFTKQLTSPQSILRGSNKGLKLCFTGTQSYTVLQSRRVCNKIAKEKEAIACSRSTGIRVSRIVGISISKEISS